MNLESVWFQLLSSKRWQSQFGLVLIFTNDHQDCSPVVLESKRFSTEEINTCDGWADELFDVFDDPFRANKVGNVRPTFRVVHGVCHIAHEHDVLAVFGHLPQ